MPGRANCSKSPGTHTHTPTPTTHHEMGGPMHTPDQQPRRLVKEEQSRRSAHCSQFGMALIRYVQQPGFISLRNFKTNTNFPLHPERTPRETTKHWPRGHRMSSDATRTSNITRLQNRASHTNAVSCALRAPAEYSSVEARILSLS